jgi:hypothetical protein
MSSLKNMKKMMGVRYFAAFTFCLFCWTYNARCSREYEKLKTKSYNHKGLKISKKDKEQNSPIPLIQSNNKSKKEKKKKKKESLI